MKHLNCDNTNCTGEVKDVQPVLMSSDFDGGKGGVVNWCRTCRKNDWAFIDTIMARLAKRAIDHFEDEYGVDYESLDRSDVSDLAKVFEYELNKLMAK